MRTPYRLLVVALALACEEPGPDYGVWRNDIAAEKKALQTEPCSEDTVLNLARHLVKAGFPEEALAQLDGRACPDSALIDDMQFDIAKKANVPPMMVKALDRMVARDPSASANYSRRAEARTLAGDKAGALSDWRQSFLLDPKDADRSMAYAKAIPADDCNAWVVWGIIWAYQPMKRAEVSLARHKVNEHGCDAMIQGTKGNVKMTLTSESLYSFAGKLGSEPVRIVTDTARPVTFVSAEIAQRLGLSVPDQALFVRSAFGTSAGQPVTLPPLELGGIVFSKLAAMVGDLGLKDADVVVGADYLTNIQLVGEKNRWTAEVRK